MKSSFAVVANDDSDLHIHILLLLFKNGESLDEMTRMLGRTENGVIA